MPRINAIEDGADPEEEDFQESGDFRLIAEFLRVGDTNQYWRAAHREAKVKLPGTFNDAERKVKVMTLFDTGVSGNNFVSQGFVERHGLLEIICPMHKKVKVADGALVEIASYLILEISFSHGNTVTTASVKFLLMNGLSMQLVIGLPTYVACSGRYFFL